MFRIAVNVNVNRIVGAPARNVNFKMLSKEQRFAWLVPAILDRLGQGALRLTLSRNF